MNILIIAATKFEIKPFTDWLLDHFPMNNYNEFDWDKGSIKVIIGGVGMLATSYYLTKEVSFHKPDLIIQAGIGGVFLDYFNAEIGDVFNVISDFNADIGVCANDGTFIPLSDLEFAKDIPFHWQNRSLDKVHADESFFAKMLQIPKARGITVNTGSKILTIPNVIKTLNVEQFPVIESMEGVALHLIGNLENIDYLQLRAISNIVEPRNPQNWQISNAINQLNQQLISLFI